MILEPDYEYCEPITVLSTNNVVFQLKLLFDKYEAIEGTEHRKFFIFFKSTAKAKNIINGLNLRDSAVFCSENSARDLKISGIEDADDKVPDMFRKYNFLTSRFFSAVDIDYHTYKCDPVTIIVSNVIAVEHSIIDPFTEAIQIIRRFTTPEDEKIKDLATSCEIIKN